VHQQVELRRRQVRGHARPVHPPGRRVDLQLAQHEPRRGAGRRQLGDPVRPPEQRVHPGRQLPRGERLGHVVVRAHPQPDQHIGFGVARGQHQHRDRPVGLDPPAHLQAVEAGQHDVEDHQVGSVGPRGRDRRRAVVRDLDGEPLGPQPRGHRAGDRRLVVHHEHAARLVRQPFAGHAPTIGTGGGGARDAV
jgi:hypothetical protein